MDPEKISIPEKKSGAVAVDAAKALKAYVRRTKSGSFNGDISSEVLGQLLAGTSSRANREQASVKSKESNPSAGAAQRFRAGRIRGSAQLRALLANARADATTWQRMSGVMGSARRGEYIDAQAGDSKNRLFTPLFSGLYTAKPGALDLAIEHAVKSDAEQYANGQFWPTVVVGSGPSASIFTAQRREASPTEGILTMDDGDRLGGQFAMAQRPLFRLNSRNRPTRGGDVTSVVLPGDAGNLNALSPGVLEVPDLDMSIYPTQNVLATACAVNTYLNSSLVSNQTKMLGVTLNRDPDTAGRYRLFTEKQGELIEVTTDKLVMASGLGKENYRFQDADTNSLIEAERSSDKPRIFTYDDFLKHFGDGTKQFPLRELAGKTISVVGDGDSAKSVIEVALGLQVRAGDSVAQADSVEKIIWWGQEYSTKEDLCEQLRARYSLIGVEAPRRSVDSVASRIEAVADKAERISKVSDSERLSLRGESNGISRQSDIIVIAKGYEPELDNVLQGLARPTQLAGNVINDNYKAQEQLAKALKPGSVIYLEGDDQASFVEILPDISGGIRLRYTIDGQVVDKPYKGTSASAAIMQVLSCGRVESVDAICLEDLPPDDGAVVAERILTAEEIQEFINKEQGLGREVYVYEPSRLIFIDEDRSNITDRLVDIQAGGTDFFAEGSYDTRREYVNLTRYLDGDRNTDSRTGALISLPKADTSLSMSEELARYVQDGDAEGMAQYIAPGFGVSFYETDKGVYVSCIVTEVEGDRVIFIDQTDLANLGPNEAPTQTLSKAAFTARYLELRGTSRTQNNFRIPYSPPPYPEFAFDAVESLEGGVEYKLGFENLAEAKGYIVDQQKRGASVVVTGTGTTIEVVEKYDGISDPIKGYQQYQTEASIFESDRKVGIGYFSELYDTLEDDDSNDDFVVLALPEAAVPSERNNRYYADKFINADREELDQLLIPGFAVTFEDEIKDRRTFYVVDRKSDVLTYIDVTDSLSEIVGGVDEFIAEIQESFVEYKAAEYTFGVRVPRPAAVLAASQVPLDIAPALSSDQGRKIKVNASKLSMTDISGQEDLPGTSIAKGVFGENVYVIGPPAKLALSEKEQNRLQPLGIDENAVAIFRYAPRNRSLAEALPRSRPGNRDVKVEKPALVIKPSEATSQRKMVVDAETLAMHANKTQLPYDIDLNEASSFALAAALQGKVSSKAPSSIAISGKIVNGKMQLVTTTAGMTRASANVTTDILFDDSLFMTAFWKLAKGAPTTGAKEISFDLTPNGVNPYSITIKNTVRQPAVAAKK